MARNTVSIAGLLAIAIAGSAAGSSAQAQSLSGQWRLGSATLIATHRGTSVTLRWANGTPAFRGTRSGNWVRGQGYIRGIHPSLVRRCPQARGMHWVTMELIVTDNGRKLVGRYFNPNWRYALSGPARCRREGGVWKSVTFTRAGPATGPRRETRPLARNCGVCGRALRSDVRAGLGNSARLRSYVRHARTKYANCVRRIPGRCGQSRADWLYRYGLPGCRHQRTASAYSVCIRGYVN